MALVTRYILVCAAFSAASFLRFGGEAQSNNQSTASDNPALLRQVLANQPDYVAMQQFIFDEGFGGFGARSKVAKRGSRLREETDDAIFFHERGKPTIKLYPKRKEYAEMPAVESRDFTIEPEELAKRDNMVFRSLGTEKVGEYSCRKIEVTYKDEKLKEMRFEFCAAPELNNLVVMRQIFMGPVTMTTVLSDVSLSVPEVLFRIPAGYKKVIEKSYEEEMEEWLDQLKERGKPVRRPRTRG